MNAQARRPETGPRPTRREVLAIAVGLLRLAPVGLAGCDRGGSAARAVLALLEGELSLPDPLDVGRSVVSASPGRLDLLELWRQVLDGLPLGDPSALTAAWRQRCIDDFDSDRLLVVDGWRIARAEGTLCAALALESAATAA